MRNPLICLALACAPLAATAEPQTIEINNIYPIGEEIFQLRDRVFYTVDNIGGFEVVQGPVDDGPARCTGSGFVFRDGRTTVGGICIFGEGADTFTMEWTAGEQGRANEWTIRHGTGTYAGMTGTGIATTDIVTSFQALPLRKTHIIGVVELPE